jgi:hypothetical protein
LHCPLYSLDVKAASTSRSPVPLPVYRSILYLGLFLGKIALSVEPPVSSPLVQLLELRLVLVVESDLVEALEEVN